MKKIDYNLINKECYNKVSCKDCIYCNYCNLLDCDSIEFLSEEEYDMYVEECEEIEIN